MPDHKEIRILLGFISQLGINATEAGDELNRNVSALALQWAIDNNILGDIIITSSLLLRFQEEATQACIDTFDELKGAL